MTVSSLGVWSQIKTVVTPKLKPQKNTRAVNLGQWQ